MILHRWLFYMRGKNNERTNRRPDCVTGVRRGNTFHTYFQVKRYFTKDSWEWEHYDLSGQQIGHSKLEEDGRLEAGWGNLTYYTPDKNNENWLFFRSDDYSFNESQPALKIPVIDGINPGDSGMRPVSGDYFGIREGVLVVYASDTGKYGAIDKNGRFVIPCEYDKLYSSRNGFLAYKKGSDCGLLENPVTPPKAVTDIAPEKTDTTQQEVAAVTLVKAQSKSAGKVTVTWKSGACDGYQIAFSRNKSFPITKTKLVGTNSSNSAVKTMTVGGLSTGKTYYVRVRAYQTMNGKMCYGAWSAAKKVKIKK